MEPLPWVFVLLRHKQINLHRLDSPELALQIDTIFVNYDVISPAIPDPPSWIHHFGFHYFLKVKK